MGAASQDDILSDSDPVRAQDRSEDGSDTATARRCQRSRPTGSSRRSFLKAGGWALLGAVGGALAAPGLARALGTSNPAGGATAAEALGGTSAQNVPIVLVPSYIADVNGNGAVGTIDVEVVRQAMGTRRGPAIQPIPGYDYRADIFGRNSVNPDDLEAVELAARVYGPLTDFSIERRPITVAWHYGWYNEVARPPMLQTAKFLGGDYASNDPLVEATFNDLKNEFGITVDALSWISSDKNPRIEDNYRQGYLKAANAGTRYVALLYESTISLPFAAARIDFVRNSVRGALVDHFARMGRFLAEVRDTSPARIFTLDNRPVMFIFGTHVWGVTPPPGFEYDAMDVAIDDARRAFAAAYGTFPYIVGEEVLLASSDIFGPDRRRRSRNFDALFNYHHIGDDQKVAAAEGLLQFQYMVDNKQLVQRTYRAVRLLRNRFTSRPILVIPSLAAGFAKRGHVSLLTDRGAYADFMKLMTEVHFNEYLLPNWGTELGTPRLPAAVYTVGSWNEEFEGHAVFPSSLNESLLSVQLDGFDLSSAIKQLFSWNHYAQRPIVPPPPAPPAT